MAGARPPSEKKAAPGAVDELRRAGDEHELRPPRPAAGLRRAGAATELRRQAEDQLAELPAAADAAAASPLPEDAAAASLGPEDVVAVVHDLRVHQIELEMQNEELRRAQLELQTSRDMYFELFDLAPVGYLTMSDKGIVGDANCTAAHLLGVERQLLVGQPFSAFVLAPDRDVYYLHQRKLQQTEQPQTCELRLQRVGGAEGAGAEETRAGAVAGRAAGVGAAAGHFWAHLEGRPRRVADGAPLSCWVTFSDVDERVVVEEELTHLNDELAARAVALEEANVTITQIAATDHLTGLANRRHFLESLAQAVSLARRHGSPLALASFDLDGLKRVNDSFRHEAGDEVLSDFATLLGSLCRAEDLPARLGGDEFSLLLPGIDLSGARGLAERVLTAVRSCAALQRRGVTVSGGLAAWTPDELPGDLLRRADEALYAAKRAGGGGVAGHA